MKKIFPFLVTAILVSGCVGTAFSEENIGGGGARKANPGEGFAAGCVKSTNIIYMDLNNVRCPILMNGDMWWDAINNIARYEIPKGSGKTSQFAGAVWIGGKDAGGNLKLAAQTYRQSGVDYWPGPLDTFAISIDPQECLNYDQHWKLLKSDVQAFVNWKNTGLPTNYVVPQAIQTWPGNGDPGRNEGHFLAPFNESIKLSDTANYKYAGIYKWQLGDYPNFDLSSKVSSGSGHCYIDGSQLYGDQNIWWVFNDEGNIHTETNGAPIGLEIRAEAFCFQTNNDINNCTFYNYQVINRSSNAVYDTWFGAWDDFDLGYAFDDYTGCDVTRGLGLGYNGEAFDPGTFGYGFNPPCVGQDFFQGPLADPNDGIDNNRNGIIDEDSEQIIMSQFVWYNNDFSVQGNPFSAEDYYNYMKGIWRDGTHMTYGGSGHGGSVACNFMFPGNSDPRNWGTNLGLTLRAGTGDTSAQNQGPTPPVSDWSEVTAGDVPGDRRFLQSAGSFTLKAGAVNDVVRGVPWGRATEGGPTASIPICQATSDDAQALFNNCFGITNGPDAPNMSIRELNQELILSITPWLYGNDSIETNYAEKDPYITHGTDINYYFQGYQIFQFANASVTVNDIGNPDLVVQIKQCDIKDSVVQIINEVLNPSLNTYVATEEVNGANTGLQHTFDITTDAFASGTSQTLINHQTYYFCVLAYAYNAGEVCNDTFPPTNGHCQPYLSGRRNVFTYTAVPHIPDPQDGGLLLNSSYGDRPAIERLEGTGNGGLVLDMTQGSINQALSSASNYRVNNPVYQSTGGPIDVSIYDPVAVGNYNFLVYLMDTTVNSKWYITNTTTGITDSSDHSIQTSSEKLFPQWGIRVNIQQVTMAGDPLNAPGSNGFLVATTQFHDSTKQWLTGIPTSTADPALNWMFLQNSADSAADPKSIYTTILGGTWGPYLFASDSVTGPAYPTSPTNLISSSNKDTSLNGLASVNVVLTSDQSLWSRSVVIEEDANSATAEGNAAKGSPRIHASVDKNGMTDAQVNDYDTLDPNSPDFISKTGMGWFPGYAINEETGERLNIMFGENSYLVSDYGNDMLFDPSPNIFSPFGDPELGGMHYIYIMGHSTGTSGSKITVAYDNCQMLKTRLDSADNKLSGTTGQILKYSTWSNCMWVGLPLLVAGDTWLETADTIRIRVAKSYRNYNVGSTYNPYDFSPNQGIPYYSFSTNGLETQTNQSAVAKNALDLINIVPNPYYAYSSYEINQLSNDVKITNLPNNCTVTIFTSSGILVKTFNRNVPSSTDLTAGEILPATTNSSISTETSIDWNLTNFDGIQIAGGVYIIHIQAPGLGERIIKWFGVMRPIDLQTF